MFRSHLVPTQPPGRCEFELVGNQFKVPRVHMNDQIGALAVIRGAADKEPFAAVLGRRLLHDRLTAQTERIRKYLGDDLKPGLSVDQAGQR